MIHILVADDDPTLRAALVALLAQEKGMNVVDAVGTADEAVTSSVRHSADVALIDVRMPGGGVEAARAIARESPSTKVLALSAQRDRETVLEMLEAGAVGYLTKGSPVETILDSIVRAAAGQGSLSAEITGSLIDELVEQRSTKRDEDARHRRKLARIERVLTGDCAVAMVFQPIYQLAGREPIGVEALARFSGAPQRRPDEWFAEAFEVGLGIALEVCAVQKAFASLPSLVTDQFLAVNVSPVTVMSPAFRELIATVDGRRVVIEITEHAPITDYEALTETLTDLRARGVRLAIDDAGAGFASLRHILRLNPDLIKLDQTLVSGIADDHAQQALAAGITSFAQGIEATLIAEGIEREEELAQLTTLGVTHGQGYYLARPGPLAERFQN